MYEADKAGRVKEESTQLMKSNENLMILRRFVKSVNLCIAKTSTRGAGNYKFRACGSHFADKG